MAVRSAKAFDHTENQGKKNMLFRDVILAKDGFTKGNASEFSDFIQRKRKG